MQLFPFLDSKFLFLVSCEKNKGLIVIFVCFRYESEFFQCVVNGVGIVSSAAVDRSRPDGYSDELIGFVTAKFVLAKESEVTFCSMNEPLFMFLA